MPDSLCQTSEILKNLAQAIAVLGAGAFFLIRWIRGWIYTNLSLSSSVTRKRSATEEGVDNAIVTIRLEKGERGNARLESVVVTAYDIRDPDNPISKASPNIRHPGGMKNLNLPPGETAQFDVHFIVGSSITVLFETEVIAHGPTWKTSLISTPIDTHEKNTT